MQYIAINCAQALDRQYVRGATWAIYITVVRNMDCAQNKNTFTKAVQNANLRLSHGRSQKAGLESHPR